ncbi:RNA-directed DNA polymerase [Methanohalophilus halophilus]|uniref:RNA-directed DNA polymerase n=1 Tax=Methanohalophilus halophilus TaxID=2177 RepID=A0A1L3Q038_9EURY|nr:RNA-directed DNA polymerase [Methanohalophilus halophilus]APH38223.1 hypothetical protein BHR79_01140 [Methanohalophilus halophilus]RNI10910.1 RNA-directed DNA polymerase [Methanohalophilus halophilus]SDV99748.1 Reverse transcriptase (RNA-dependent DNA polymerase) [Methanohalophilus halophilus]
MNLKNLLENGYFPKELPPAFSTESFASKHQIIDSQWNPTSRNDVPKIPNTQLTDYLIPKKNHIRRKLSIVNPISQFYLSKFIIDNWAEIKAHCSKSELSTSRPVENCFENPKNKRSIQTLNSFQQYKKKCITCSYDRMFELKTDISWFYPSIYTHSIPWALHTKEEAKNNRNDYQRYYGNVLDKYMRACQSGQTNGIPTGPDNSHIIAEIILCAIDQKLKEEFPDLKGYRYYDDYCFYLSNRDHVDNLIVYLQSILNEYQLVLNEQKTIINHYPMAYDDPWVLSLSTFSLRKNESMQEKDIWKYFNLAFDLFDEHRSEHVLKYAIRRIKEYEIYESNWDLFESLLFKCTLLDAKTIKPIIEILLYYKEFKNQNKIKDLIHTLLGQHLYKKHSYELSWILWMAKTFEIKIPANFANTILRSNDVIPQVLVLDLINKNLLDSDLDTSFLADELTSESLYENKWLLTYEATMKGWITPNDSGLLDNDDYFSVLKENDISFYDEDKQLTPIEIKDEEGNSDGDEPYGEYIYYSFDYE